MRRHFNGESLGDNGYMNEKPEKKQQTDLEPVDKGRAVDPDLPVCTEKGVPLRFAQFARSILEGADIKPIH
jgi:hypothetical protein